MFLQSYALDEIKDRLSLVNKEFTKPAVVTGFPDFWENAFPGAKVVSDTDTLALDPGAHDLVLHAMSLHWANDPVGQLIQCRRALKPDGLFMAALAGGQTLNELRASLAQAETEVAGGLSPRVLPMADIRALGDLLIRASFALPVADNLVLNTTYTTPRALMLELRRMGEGNALSDRLRRPTSPAVMRRAERIYREMFSTGDNRVKATFELVFLLGWAPDPSQPQPLRPGSAVSRLADALGAQEQVLKD